MPAVVVATEHFTKLAKLIMRSQSVPDSIAIIVKGNPEYMSQEELSGVCEDVVEDVLARLTHVKGKASDGAC